MKRLAIALALGSLGCASCDAVAAPDREAAVAAVMAKAASDPGELRLFLRAMPKGGDLHNHLSGAIYAEDYIGWARDAGFCATTDGLGIDPPPCPEQRSLNRAETQDSPGENRLIDSLSMRGWQRGVGREAASGHGQFFQTFGRFGSIAQGNAGRMLAAVRRSAGWNALSYLELDHNTDVLSADVMGAVDTPLTEADIPSAYAREVARVGPLLLQAQAELDRDEARARTELACATAKPDAGCGVAVHYLFQAFRALPPAQAFRSLVLGFALAAQDKRYVGINIVQPEDARVALRDYDLHMAMIRFLAGKYPTVRRTLHAGELAQGLVAPQHLRDHIAKAVAAGAERIGHGTDIALEQDGAATMARMAHDGVAVELNLTSNAVILGVSGADHPLRLYRSHGVPVVLSTDDQGVLRTDMTNEYVRAVREQGLGYGDLKALARASIEYAFMPGSSLWQNRHIGEPTAACAAGFDTKSCTAYAAGSEKARLQVQLERAFDRFELSRLNVAGAM